MCGQMEGVHAKVRLGQAQSCVLVVLGMRLDGTEELIRAGLTCCATASGAACGTPS